MQYLCVHNLFNITYLFIIYSTVHVGKIHFLCQTLLGIRDTLVNKTNILAFMKLVLQAAIDNTEYGN